MRALFACGMLIAAGSALAAPAPRATAAHPPAVHPSAAHLAAPASPLPLAARPRPGKNAPTTLGGPAKYDAKKGAMLGGAVMPHRP